jgi:SAM-dependent methyltransferase
MPLQEWLDLNARLAFEDSTLLRHVAPFPPEFLMRNVSGLTSPRDFAAHGVALLIALNNASPAGLLQFHSILDFGCGCGRLARMLKGFPGRLVGCDIDARHIEWVNANLDYMSAVHTVPNQPLPFAQDEFDCIISISVFTHLDEQSQHLYLQELARCVKPGGHLFLTVHGERAMARALHDDHIYRMLDVPRKELEYAAARLQAGKYGFIRQNGHLTTATYNYGITFIPSDYVYSQWGRYFRIGRVVSGAIHDFQDIVVCQHPVK